MARGPEDGVRIPVHGRGGIVAHALVDLRDAWVLGEHRWHLTTTGYARRTTPREGGRQRYVQMHRQIMGLQPGDKRVVDHINHDPLDNRRSNLRVGTRAQNQQNMSSHVDGGSRFRGVHWSSSARKWQARVCVEGERHHLGLFEDEVEAARAADAFRESHMEYAQPDPELAKLEEVS